MAIFYKLTIFIVIKKHLGHNKISAHVYLLLQVFKIGFQVWGLKMLFGIPGYTNTEIGIDYFMVFIQILTAVHIHHLLQKISCIRVATGGRYKPGISPSSITTQPQH